LVRSPRIHQDSTGSPRQSVGAIDVDLGLGFLEQLAGISSPSTDRVGLRRCAERLVAIGRRVGLVAGIEDHPEGPVVILGNADKPGYLLALGHLDTVLPARPVERRQDRVIATGAIDMKGGFAAFFAALAALRRAGAAVPQDLVLVAVPDEEIGGPLAIEITRRFGAEARELWVLEPGSRTAVGHESLVLGRRGMFDWSIEITGHSAHAGNAFAEGRSALLAGAALAQQLAALGRPEAGITVNPARLVAGEASLLATPATLARVVGTPAQTNVIPNRAVLDGEVRFRHQADAQRLRVAFATLVEEVAGAAAVQASVRLGEVLAPLEATPHRLDRGMRAVELGAALGLELELEHERGGVSFPNFLPAGADIPVLDGLGPAGDGMHTTEEYVLIESFAARVRLLAALLADDAERSPTG
jgi:glutamate carboxypeptidase